MKKRLILFLAFAISLVFVLCSCEGMPGLSDFGGLTPHEHNFVNYVSDGNATCTEDGTKTAKCDKCNKTYTLTDVGSRKGHTLGEFSSDNNATCTEDGTRSAVCSTCGESISAPDIGSAGHKYGSLIAAKAESCTADGNVAHYKCSSCKKFFDTDKKPIDSAVIKAGHKEEVVAAVAPACTETGLTEGKKCSVCDEVLVEQEIVSATGHDYKDGFCLNCEMPDPDSLSSNIIWSPGMTVAIIGGKYSDSNSLRSELEAIGLDVIIGEGSGAISNEIVIGNTTREISKKAYKNLEARIGSGGDKLGWVIYAYKGSLAVAYNDETMLSLARDYIRTDLLTQSTLTLDDGVVSYFAVDLKEAAETDRETMREDFFERVEQALGKAAADESRALFEILNADTYKWMLNLYSPEKGGFYYSDSARDYNGFLPDIESTATVLSFLKISGFCSGNNNGVSECLPDEISEAILKFVRDMQSSEDGYFYHPQWGTNVSDTRRARDLAQAHSVLSMLRQQPYYDTPNGLEGLYGPPSQSAVSAAVTLPIDTSKVIAVSKVVATATLPAHFSSEDAFKDYLIGLDIYGNSHVAGQIIQSQMSQIKMCGYENILLSHLNSIQNTSNGIWDDEVSINSIDGLMYIAGIYWSEYEEMPNLDKAFLSAFSLAKDTSEFAGDDVTVNNVYNTLIAMRYVLNTSETGLSPEISATLKAEAEDFIAAIRENLSRFKRQDGGFSHYTGKTLSTRYDLSMSVEGVCESDIYSTATAISTIYLTYLLLDFTPYFYSELDGRIFFNELLSVEPVEKKDVGAEENDACIGNGGTAPHTVVKDPAVPATCVAEGLTEGSHCSECNTVILKQNKISKTAHTEVVDESELPTCTKPGITEGKHCSVCETVIVAQKVIPAAGHKFEDGICSICGEDESIEDDPVYDWGTTMLYIEYNENTNYNELSSGTRRYYAGQDLSCFTNIDNQIRVRNTYAEKQAKVTLKYKYLPDETGYGWGGNIGRMVSQTSVTATDSPDIYVNFVYDLTGAALKGCFANLKGTYQSGNYFRFNEADYDPTSDNYFDSDAGEGYFYEYMQSLSLSPDDKLYCLASNFCVDIVRAMVVVPVNVELMNSITSFDKLPTTDSNGNGKHDVKDFYQLVWSNKWNYAALAAYSNVIYKESGKSAGSDIDDTLGFCAGTTSGLTSSALLYSSSVKFIEWNEDTKQYQYRESNPEYVAVAEALRKLFNENASGGIATISTAEAKTAGYTDGDLQAIRTRFSENKILFGGTIMVGSLEDNVYQEMAEGFGIVPVPVYKDGEEYLTLVHSIARIVAISKNSKVKSQASAYLDYQSRNSSDILEDYYEFQLTAAVSGGLAGEDNKQMMIYIRNHVRDCFDKTYDDAISAYIGEDAKYQTWHHFLAEARYQLSNANNKYSSFYKSKENNFKIIYESWNRLE